MKFWLCFALIFALATCVLSWEKEDHEIFDLVSELQTAEGKGTTFYSWLDVPSSASTVEISKAYKKMSRTMHPDKNPGVKDIEKRFARLGVIAKILRNKDSRKRYDFFYKNGVPRWKGSGYFYSRYRPGLGTVLVFLVVLTSGLQYLIQGIKYKQDVVRIEKIVGDAKTAAWGNRNAPLEGQRKVRVNLGGSRTVDEDGNANPGRMLDMVVEGANVYILEPNGALELLDASAATKPAIMNTWLISLVRKLVGGGFKAQRSGAGTEDDGTDSTDDSSVSGRSTPDKRRKDRKRR
ncbi:DnaJ domain-containing protein [Pterulicium gracile]|uniref:DnaJ domain-containing protein n=1 Tax=Pterulicium gracile TaxID=1884261 RepID=A0A5C3QZX7_9AGAR|nr:DnaJ domain-containing protein [Pterula gracilis]